MLQVYSLLANEIKLVFNSTIAFLPIKVKKDFSRLQEVFGDFCLATGRLPVGRVADVLQVLGLSPLQSEVSHRHLEASLWIFCSGTYATYVCMYCMVFPQVEEWTEKYKKKGLEYKDLLSIYTTPPYV